MIERVKRFSLISKAIIFPNLIFWRGPVRFFCCGRRGFLTRKLLHELQFWIIIFFCDMFLLYRRVFHPIEHKYSMKVCQENINSHLARKPLDLHEMERCGKTKFLYSFQGSNKNLLHIEIWNLSILRSCRSKYILSFLVKVDEYSSYSSMKLHRLKVD